MLTSKEIGFDYNKNPMYVLEINDRKVLLPLTAKNTEFVNTLLGLTTYKGEYLGAKVDGEYLSYYYIDNGKQIKIDVTVAAPGTIPFLPAALSEDRRAELLEEFQKQRQIEQEEADRAHAAWMARQEEVKAQKAREQQEAA